MKKPEEIKKVTPKCPWCGAEMRFDADGIHVWFKCDNCLAASPKAYRIWDTGLKNAENWAVNESIALDRIQQLEAQVPRWIPVEERLPEDQRSILTVNGHGDIRMMALWKKDGDKMTWLWDGRMMHFNDITHWMPLPEAPKEG